jgi:1-deoxy-D-xylulose-5-phosphate synthase
VAEVPPVPFGSWEVLRHGKDVTILAVGTMVLPAVEAADRLRIEGIDAGVVNCRFLKPYDVLVLEQVVHECKSVVTVEEGAVVNGFGAMLARELQSTHPEVRVHCLGVPDRLIEQAPRAQQLDVFGLTGPGIAARIAALHHEESFEAR